MHPHQVIPSFVSKAHDMSFRW